jgi:uncharacterized protein YlxW (UPF0749 family)
MERIKALRERHQELISSVEYYEEKVAEQTILLDRVHHPRDSSEVDASVPARDTHARDSYTPDDFQKEEEEMRELEEKKRTLEDRVSGMQKDLGGLRR